MQTSALKAGRLNAQSPSASSPVLSTERAAAKAERRLFVTIEKHLGIMFALSRYLDVGSGDEFEISSGSDGGSFAGLFCLELFARYNKNDRFAILESIWTWIQDTTREVVSNSS
jgi:hypothetical protein